MKKRVLSYLLAICLVVSTFSVVPIQASFEDSIANNEYYVYDGEITVGETKEVEIEVMGGSKVYKFVPQYSAKYTFTSSAAEGYEDEDTYGYLLDANGNSITFDDDGGSGKNFNIEYYLNEGETYYYQVKFNSYSKTGKFNVTLEEYIDRTIAIEYESLYNRAYYTNFLGSFVEDEQGESYFRYGYDGFYYGDFLTLKQKDNLPDRVYYYYGGAFHYVYDESDVIEVSLTDNQDEEHWVAGRENYLTVGYGDFTTQIPVKIYEQEVVDASYEQNPQQSIIEYTNGYSCEDEDGETYYHYFYIPILDGDELTLGLSDGTTARFTKQDYVFQNDDSEVISINEFSFDDNQDEQHWQAEESNNSYTLTLGKRYDELAGFSFDVYVNIIPQEDLLDDEGNADFRVEYCDLDTTLHRRDFETFVFDDGNGGFYVDTGISKEKIQGDVFSNIETLILVTNNGEELLFQRQLVYTGAEGDDYEECFVCNEKNIYINAEQIIVIIGDFFDENTYLNPDNCESVEANIWFEWLSTSTSFSFEDDGIEGVYFYSGDNDIFYFEENDCYEDVDEYGNTYNRYAYEFKEGDAISLGFYSGHVNYLEYNEEYDCFINVENEEEYISTEDVKLVDNQSRSNWTPDGENNYLVVVYNGHISPYYDVEIIPSQEESIIQKIDYTPVQALEYKEETHGYWIDESYYYNFEYNLGDKLTITTTDGNEYEYELIDQNGNNVFYCEDAKENDKLDECLSWDDISYSKNQEYLETWSAGNSYNFTIHYKGYDCDVPVSIVANEVSAISYTLVKPIVLKEGVNCETRTIPTYDNFGDVTGTEDYIHYHLPNLVNVGDTLAVSYKDERGLVYYYATEVDGAIAYVSNDGDTISSEDISISDYQYKKHFSTENTENNYFVVEYSGRSFNVGVTLLKNDIASISFTPVDASRFVFEQEKNGSWETDDYGKQYFRYNACGISNGDKLTLTYNDNSTKEFVYVNNETQNGFYASDGDMIKSEEVSFENNQESVHWVLGNDNYISISYWNVNTALPVTITPKSIDRTELDNELAYYKEYLTSKRIVHDDKYERFKALYNEYEHKAFYSEEDLEAAIDTFDNACYDLTYVKRYEGFNDGVNWAWENYAIYIYSDTIPKYQYPEDAPWYDFRDVTFTVCTPCTCTWDVSSFTTFSSLGSYGYNTQTLIHDMNCTVNGSEITYSCEHCEYSFSYQAYMIYGAWNNNCMNATTDGTSLDQNYYFDVVNDGVINAKDYALLYRLAKQNPPPTEE